ncbi:MAG: hypothetical protein ABI625_10650 [bacterium]
MATAVPPIIRVLACTALLLPATLAGCARGNDFSQTPAPAAGAVAVGLAPGWRMRARLRAEPDSATKQSRDRQIDGYLVDIDSMSVTLRLDDGLRRRLARADVESLKAYEGRSWWRGVLAGMLISIPFSVLECAGRRYECGEGSLSGLIGMFGGAAVGWDHWRDVRFPGATLD